MKQTYEEHKAQQREYARRPEVIARRKKRTEERKEEIKAYAKEYKKKPENRKKINAYFRGYYHRKTKEVNRLKSKLYKEYLIKNSEDKK